MKLIYENANTQIFNIEEEIPHTVFAYWKGFLSMEDEEALTACEESLRYFKSAGIKVMISDHKDLKGATIEFLDWLHDVYFPTAVKNGLIAEIILDSNYDMGNVVLDLMYDEEDFNRNMGESGIYTPKIDTLDNAKTLAGKIISKNS